MRAAVEESILNIRMVGVLKGERKKRLQVLVER